MGVKIILTNKNQQTKFSGKEGQDRAVRFNRLIYQKFGSLVQNKVISEDFSNKNMPTEFYELLEQLNLLQIDPTSTAIKEETKAIDEYLGSLGDTEIYPYAKDAKDIPAWIDILGGHPFRNVIDTQNNIKSNVTAGVVGETYNVIHKT